MDYSTFLNTVSSETQEMIKESIRIFSIIEDIDFKYFTRKTLLEPEEFLPQTKHDRRILSMFLAALRKNEKIKEIFKEVGLTSEALIQSINEKNGIDIKIPHYIMDEDIDYDSSYVTNFDYIIDNLKSMDSVKAMNPEILIYNSCYSHMASSNLIEFILIHELNNCEFMVTEAAYMKRLKSVGEQDRALRNVPKFDRSEALEKHRIGAIQPFPIERKLNLKKYGVVMTEENYKFNPAIGRDKEIEKVLVSLLTDEVSPILVGKAGVGKTAIVEGIAYRIKNGLVPSKIANKKIIKLNVSSLVAGCKYVGMFQERIEEIMAETIKDKNSILFIDEIHSVIGAGAGSSQGQDLANILKPYIDRGDVKLIGATTTDEYHEYIAKDPAFKRRFEKIDIPELGKNELLGVVLGVIEKVEEATSVKWNANIDFKYNVIGDILDATSKEKRVYNDNVNNPDLVLKIVKKAFAYAQLEDDDELSISHFVKSIDGADRLYPSVRETVVSKLIGKYSDESAKEEIDNVIPFPQLRKLPIKK